MLKEKKKRQLPVLKDPNRICVQCGKPYQAKAPLQKTCSHECRKKLWDANAKTFRGNNPDSMKVYNANRLKKNPDAWKEKTRKDRLEILQKLGGKCVVPGCSAGNSNWLHVDYIPTMQGTGYRHPRHKKWVMDHIKDFRILCANHHYELTITGKIEGTEIIQNN